MNNVNDVPSYKMEKEIKDEKYKRDCTLHGTEVSFLIIQASPD